MPRFREEFWGELDQRLHNMVSSAVAVVDHTRPLLAFYEHESEFVAEWGERSDEVAKSPRALFLRRLRNYLLHYGVAPLTRSMVLGPPKVAKDWDDLTIRLSPDGLLRYSDWNGSNREYIHSFEGGPPLRQITQEYGEDMTTLYNWLFSQYPVLHVPGVPPAASVLVTCNVLSGRSELSVEPQHAVVPGRPGDRWLTEQGCAPNAAT